MLHAEFKSAALASLGSQNTHFAKPILKTSIVAAVYQQLLEAILCGALQSGQELNEVAIAKELQVSRTPVHEALRRLGSDGLVEALPNGKSRVVSLTKEGITALYEMRIILEGAATALAAKNISQDRLHALRKEATDLDKGPLDDSWPSKAISFDLHFHDVVAESSGNEFLRKDILRHRRLVQGFCRITGTISNLRAAFEEHLKILEALEARNASAAQEAMAAHIDSRLTTLLNLLEKKNF